MLTTLPDAVASVPDGATVYIGNFGAQLFSVGHELVRQRRTGLHIIAASGGILLDDLIAESVTSAVTTSHCWNPVGPARTVHFQRGAQEGWLQVVELSFGALCSALQAAAMDLPFATTTNLRGTDYLDSRRSGGMLSTLTCEFGEATVVRALTPDVAFVHVDRASEAGSGWLEQPTADALLATQAARRTILVAEEIGPGAGQATIPHVLVADVVLEPGAVRPDGASGRYPRDLDAYAAYSAAAASPQGRAQWRNEVALARG